MKTFADQLTRRLLPTVALGLGLLAAWPSMAQAQETIRSGDELSVSIPEAGGTTERVVRVDSSGEIGLGIYGTVQVSGLSIDEAEREVRRVLSRYLRNTSGVHLTLERSQRVILVTGQVQTPGLTTLEGAADPWLAIQSAGGPGPGADLSRVLLFRDGEERPLDIRAYLTRESADELPALFSGDTIFVPAEPGFPAIQRAGAGAGSPAAVFLGDEALRTKVFVLGAVATPGVYERSPGLNPMMALALAGGPAPNADLSTVRLITPSSSQILDLEAWMLGESAGPEEIPGDGGAIMYVPGRGTGNLADPFTRPVYLMGSLNLNGPFEIGGPTPLAELLGRAGGPTANADLEEIVLVRQRERYSLRAHYDFERYLDEGGGLGSALVEPGDVLYVDAKPDRTAWTTFIEGVRDIAVISSAALLWVNFLQD